MDPGCIRCSGVPCERSFSIGMFFLFPKRQKKQGLGLPQGASEYALALRGGVQAASVLRNERLRLLRKSLRFLHERLQFLCERLPSVCKSF